MSFSEFSKPRRIPAAVLAMFSIATFALPGVLAQPIGMPPVVQPPVSISPPPHLAAEAQQGLRDTWRIFISQYRSRFNPNGTPRNNNCGPACVAMALRWFKLFGMHLTAPTQAEQEVRWARGKMTGRPRQDDKTGMADVVRAAHQYGMSAKLARSMEEIDRELAAGKVAVVSGSALVDRSYGARLGFTQGKAGHFILITKKVGDQYVLADPESLTGPHLINRQELIAFQRYYHRAHPLHGAVMLGRTG
jgi:predicted double-glycine peptidase